MNNGRDCPHGRQVGKCDTCDLIVAELELQKVTAERDALMAQVSRLLDEINFSVVSILARTPSDEIHAIACSMAETAKATPQHHLAKIRAEAGRAGFVAGYMLCNDGSPLIKHNYEGFADKYTESIRQGKVK